MLNRNNILLDIDGCITEGKGMPVNLITLNSLKERISLSSYKTKLCTGRSASYVEAIAQILDIQDWCICENGSYLYNTKTEEFILHPKITIDDVIMLKEIKQKLFSDKIFTNYCKVELGKEVCISLNPLNISIELLYEHIINSLNLDFLNITYSKSAVDISPIGVNKGSMLQYLCEFENLTLEDIVGIGDSMGDISFLEICGTVCCPGNAIDTIKKISNFTSPKSSTQGLIEIYNWLEKSNYNQQPYKL